MALRMEMRHCCPFRVSPLPGEAAWRAARPSYARCWRSGLLAGFERAVSGSESHTRLEASSEPRRCSPGVVRTRGCGLHGHGAHANRCAAVFPESRTQEALKSGHFVDVLSILLRLQRICNHPGLVEPRLPESSYTAGPLQYRSASLILQALDGDSWKVRVLLTSVADTLWAAPGLQGASPCPRPERDKPESDSCRGGEGVPRTTCWTV